MTTGTKHPRNHNLESMQRDPDKKENRQKDTADKPDIKAGDQYAKGWESTEWDIVGNRPDVSKRQHVSGHPVTGNDDGNEVHGNDDSGSSQRGLGGTTDDNRGNVPKP